MGESLLEPLPDSQLADVVPGVQQARDVCESTANKAQDLQRSSNFNAMQQCTTVSPTATDSSPFVVSEYRWCKSRSDHCHPWGHLRFVSQVLMGWVNCSDKYLKKYSDLLAGLGFSSVRTIQPTFQAFSLYESPRRVWASNILDFLIAQQAPSRSEVGVPDRFAKGAGPDLPDPVLLPMPAGQWFCGVSVMAVAGYWSR